MGKVARGGGSGQGRSPGLAGGGKGKGKARVDQVVKALSGKTVDGKQAKKKKRAVPHCGACQKWGHTSRSKLCALYQKKK